MINLLVQNPSLVQGFMQDQRIMTTILALMGIDVGSMSGAAKKTQPESHFAGQPSPASAAPKQAPKPAPAAPSVAPAQKLKEEGNDLYKKRQFDEARSKYEEAFALEPTVSTYLLNVSAVVFEQQKYDECLKTCDTVIEHLLEHNPTDFNTKSKALTRKAS